MYITFMEECILWMRSFINYLGLPQHKLFLSQLNDFVCIIRESLTTL
jgi:hypothetical protein